MRTYCETKKTNDAKLYEKQVCQLQEKNKTTKIVDLLKAESEEGHSSLMFSGVISTYSDDHLSAEQLDKAAHHAMLEMLSINRNYYDQVSNYSESA